MIGRRKPLHAQTLKPGAADPICGGLGRSFSDAAKHLCNQGTNLGQALGGLGVLIRTVAVHLQNRPEQHGADGTMRRGTHAANRSGQPMHRPKPGIGQRKAAAQADPC